MKRTNIGGFVTSAVLNVGGVSVLEWSKNRGKRKEKNLDAASVLRDRPLLRSSQFHTSGSEGNFRFQQDRSAARILRQPDPEVGLRHLATALVNAHFDPGCGIVAGRHGHLRTVHLEPGACLVEFLAVEHGRTCFARLLPVYRSQVIE